MPLSSVCTHPSPCSFTIRLSCMNHRFLMSFKLTGVWQLGQQSGSATLESASLTRNCDHFVTSPHLHLKPGSIDGKSLKRTLRSKMAFKSPTIDMLLSSTSPFSSALTRAACENLAASMPMHSASRAGLVPSTTAKIRVTKGCTCCFLYHWISMVKLLSISNSCGCRARSARRSLDPSALQMTYPISCPGRTGFPLEMSRRATWTCGCFLASG
mmetsp:Transcript_77541/g.122237  ORF Transcript_77541/g.122237 Transcript_77541/m.122237 type:complete len:213 (+) Transcript_77541:318-956(+)